MTNPYMENYKILPLWITRNEAIQITGVAESSLNNWLAARKIHPRCARKQGRNWKFNRNVLEEFGFVFADEKFPPIRNH